MQYFKIWIIFQRNFGRTQKFSVNLGQSNVNVRKTWEHLEKLEKFLEIYKKGFQDDLF